MSTQREVGSGALSLRLSAVAEWIPPGRVVADIGSDHAQLLIALSRSGLLNRGIAGEVNQGPWENARHRVKEAKLEHQIQVRKGDGLEVLDTGEAQVIVIAGMGGPLIASILDRGLQKLERVERLVLQPNSGVVHVRRWLHRHGWKLDGENLVREAGILYEVVTAVPGDPHEPYRKTPLPLDAAFEVGPLLWMERHPLLLDKLEAELEGLNRILSQLESARAPEARSRLESMKQKREEWRRWRQWLQQDGN
ncbi:tRNA (adenine(22)-N(1))-methyltransferase [Desmospora profundinema]|uniref:tRNA (Adenine22-N1)-methyltransferase n=1 Tax=Desmospora profundinema TaxID=1571184 RepID=A0ABU1IJR4_9BACL|nr:class I SAM-dependent methyltransferase [Desmospora profundinema]MDR6225019.1 tRNA (adenine22-N1)-methyltransferase [Desmospora profundinema]